MVPSYGSDSGAATVLAGQADVVAPDSLSELRGAHGDYRAGGRAGLRCGGGCGGDGVDPRAESKDQTGVVLIQDEVASGEEDFSRGGDG